MKSVHLGMLSLLIVLVCGGLAPAHQSATTATNVQVPPVIQFSNVATDEAGSPLSGSVALTFSLYNNAQGGEALWTETQNVPLDSSGHYSVYLGITKPNGLPISLFTNGQAHWLGVQPQGQPEQARVFLVSVPYAMKAGDAATIGGLPPSAFVMANAPNSNHASNSNGKSNTKAPATETQDYIPFFTDGSGDLGNSILYEAGGNEIGIGTTTPAATLEVNGTAKFDGLATFNSAQTFPGTLTGVTAGTGISVTGSKTDPTININTTFANEYYPQLDAANTFTKSQTVEGTMTATTFSGNGAGLTNVTATNSNELGGLSATAFAQLGASSNTFTGGITAATFAGNGAAVTNVNAALLNGLASSAFQPAGSYATLGANTFTGSQTVNGNMSVGPTNSFNLGGVPFAFGSYSAQNAFLGFAGNTSTTGGDDLAIGSYALAVDTNGSINTAVGASSLTANTMGSFNTAEGGSSLFFNKTGSYNIGVGFYSSATQDDSSIAGSFNTAVGSQTELSTGSLSSATMVGYGVVVGGSNATAIGAEAEVDASNSLVLGSINGVNGATADTHVGIGTTTPSAKLDIGADELHTYIGGACATNGFGGIAFGNNGFQNCANYSLMGDGTNTYINAPSGGSILFRFNNASPSAVAMDFNGRVGIGTNSPDDLLSVNGSADKPGGGSWGTFSDARLKTVNGGFTDGLSQVMKINPIHYRYKPGNAMGIRDMDEHIGVVAQEVQKVIPEAVTENSKGYLLVNNDPIIWTMLNAIKEQQRQIRRQQNLLRAQAATMRSLKAEVRETGESLHRVKAQVAVQPALVAGK